MSTRPEPRIPETRRRRADTIAKSEHIMALSKHLTLTRSVLAETLAEATPAQLDFIEHWFQAEIASREAAKRARLLKAAGFPADKTLDDYDWNNLTMPADWGRSQLEGLEFVDRHECPRALRERRHRQDPPRHRPRTGRLQERDTHQVLHRLKPGHEAETSQTGQPARQGAYDDRQGRAHHPRRARLHPHRRGGQPPALPGHRRQLRDKEHHLHHQHRVRRMDPRVRRPRHGTPRSSTTPSTTDDSSASRAQATAVSTPS